MLVSTDVEILDPRYSTDVVSLRATRLIHAGLSRLDSETLEPIPYAAESWSWESPRSLRVKLRTDLLFHSGKPFDADDVVATFDAFASPEVASRHAGVVEPLLRVIKNDTHDVTFILKRDHATLLTDLEVPILRRDQAFSAPAPNGSLDGLGPYRLLRRTAGAVVLEPSDTRILPKARHSVVLRTVHDENARALRMFSGRADVSEDQLSPALLPALNREASLVVRKAHAASLTYLAVNWHHPALSNVHARAAIARSVDRMRFTTHVFSETAVPALSALPLLFADPPGEPLRFDSTFALSERAEAEREGVRWNVPIELLVSPDRFRVTLGRLLVSDWQRVGIAAELQPMEFGSLVQRLTRGDFALALMQLPELSEPNLLRHFLHSDFVPPKGANRGRVHDTNLDRWLDDGASTLNRDERRAIYTRINEHIVQTLPIIPLWHEEHVAVLSKRAKELPLSADGRWLGLAMLP